MGNLFLNPVIISDYLYNDTSLQIVKYQADKNQLFHDHNE